MGIIHGGKFADQDPDLNGSKAAPSIPYVDRSKLPNYDVLGQAARAKGEPLTQDEINALLKG